MSFITEYIETKNDAAKFRRNYSSYIGPGI